MTTHLLSKSTFLYGSQCLKRLFLHKFKPSLRNPVAEGEEAVKVQGTDIGKLARDLFPGGVDASPPDSYSYNISVNMTQTLIAQGETILYEAAFQYDDVLCAVDILIKKGDAWYAFEVKSSNSVKDQHIIDAALQHWVITNAGISLSDFSIIHLNGSYLRKGELDIHQLFTTESVLEDVIENQAKVRQKVRELKEMLALREEPVVDIGQHCGSPYKCDFTQHCWSHIPEEGSVFELAGGAGFKLYKAGYKHLNDIPEDFELSPKTAMQLAHYRSGEPYIDREAIRTFLAPLTYPLFFFDFESFMPGIPRFDESRPHQQIPFQFSLHTRREPNGPLEHHAWLGDGLSDPRKQLLNEMLGLLGTSGNIICYNMTFELSRIRELAGLYPQFRDGLQAISERVVDLMIPFVNRWYYHPQFRGRYSIKKVLPVLVPHLSYESLTIGEGTMASLVYSQLKFQNADKAAEQRKQLLDYCELDTRAMAEVLDALERIVANPKPGS